MNLLNNDAMRLMETSLKAATTRHNTIANNIANADTPGFKAERTVFKHQLAEATGNQLQAYRTDEKHINFGGSNSNESPVITKRNNTAYNHNGNNVDMDHEMAELAKNQIYYNAMIERLNSRFSGIRTALGSGR
ncbi:flagellar basal body rod protein FlgB [Paenalkalicoccus suaedae]|uniref:Flagellar basal body rod protein FlgB n=1 Tax=Paenalkalicoccus suaedae TaxID=2592382 RepID=A0A859FFQ2_9BACI|nr:flagellar basal body rod protein FlgB [Paenalkalicoccus suaedae]QKS71444.1 flagellar basal body rod protein FlgB [Paenalkalicoccus suaedae]